MDCSVITGSWYPARRWVTRNPEAHAANLFDLNAKYADVLELNEVLDHLEML